LAAQDQALNTKYYATKILHTETDSKCRLCQQLDETIDYTISACPILAKEQCVKQHDKVSKYTSTYARNWSATVQKTLVRTCTKSNSKNSRRQGDCVVESASAN